MAKMPKKVSQTHSKKPLSNGVKLALIVGGVLIVLCMIAAVAGVMVAGSVFGLLQKEGVKVDQQSGAVEITTQDGQSTFSSEATLPENYPSDIPVYPGAEVVYSVVKDGDGSNVTFRTSDSLAEVVDFYEAQLASQGWSKTQNQASYFTSGIGFAEKNPRSLALIISEENKDGKTSTVIVVTEKSRQ